MSVYSSRLSILFFGTVFLVLQNFLQNQEYCSEEECAVHAEVCRHKPTQHEYRLQITHFQVHILYFMHRQLQKKIHHFGLSLNVY